MRNRSEMRQLKPVYPYADYTHVRALLELAAEKYGNNDAFVVESMLEDPSVAYTVKNYKDLLFDVNALGEALLSLGLQGSRIAIIGDNSYAWQLVSLATTSGLGVLIPLDPGMPYEVFAERIRESGSTVLFFDQNHLPLAERLQLERPYVSYFFALDDTPAFLTIDDLLITGREQLAAGSTQFRELPIDHSAPAIIRFKTGVEGNVQSTMIRQPDIMRAVYELRLMGTLRCGDISMPKLPYHYMSGTASQLFVYSCGATTLFRTGTDIARNMKKQTATDSDIRNAEGA